jgi:hypothetical protein
MSVTTIARNQCEYLPMTYILKIVTLSHNVILLSHKQHEISSFVTTWMHLWDIVLSAISQTQKD